MSISGKITAAVLCSISTLLLAQATSVQACTRIVYQGPEATILTARSMDWRDEIPVNLWLFPRAMERHGVVGENSISWTSRYGSVIASAFDIATTDGINEKGLVANILWLAEAKYPAFPGKHKGLSVAAWAQYVLDNFATVNEAVKALQKEPFVVVSSNIPGSDRFATLHLSISDATGDSAIFEYVEGKLVIHHSKDYQVMTNSPVFEKQLALSEYWREIGGTTMLPGTNRAADRFVRASFYINAIPQTKDTHRAVASVFSVIRNASVPYGISSATEPNISSTRWRTLADHKHLVYYFEDVLTPNTIWVDLKQMDFSKGAPVKKLALDKQQIYSANATANFIATEPFEFAGL
jgi:penicillin V acylase-like amidase (Ntn superfamily)